MQYWLDQTLNGLSIGNIYALTAVGLALVFGVANLINFSHGSVYMLGAYVGWLCMAQLHLPLALTFALVLLVCFGLGVLVELVALRPLQHAQPIAPLLATIGISFILDQLTQIFFSPDPHAFASPLPNTRFYFGEASIGWLDVLIFAVTLAAALLLFTFLQYTKFGCAIRATSQNREAAHMLGVNVQRVNTLTFGIAGALGGIAGLLIGMYFNSVYPSMSFSAGIKGLIANVLGGLGSVPGALVGGLLLGLIESWGVGAFGASYRNLFAYAALLIVLLLRPNGLFGFSAAGLVPAAQRTTNHTKNSTAFLSISATQRKTVLVVLILFSFALPFFVTNAYVLQVLTSAWIYGLLALSITLVAGTAGQLSLGHAGFMAMGGYTSALLSTKLGFGFEAALLTAMLVSGIVTMLLVLPAFRLRGPYIAIATLAIGEIVREVILNWDALTNGASGVSNIPPFAIFGVALVSPQAVYWLCLVVLMACAWLQQRTLNTRVGRAWRAMRDDELAAQSFGIHLNIYKAAAFWVSGLWAGASGALIAHQYSYIAPDTFAVSASILAITIAILGGMGNVWGAVLAAVILLALPEAFRGLEQYRFLAYGLALLLLVRFRPQGLLGGR